MSENKVKIKDVIAFILKHMTAEEALEKLLVTQIHHYERLKLEKQPEDNPESVSPYFILIAATMDLGWDFAVENKDKGMIVRGLAVGTQEYLNDLFKPKTKEDDMG